MSYKTDIPPSSRWPHHKHTLPSSLSWKTLGGCKRALLWGFLCQLKQLYGLFVVLFSPSLCTCRACTYGHLLHHPLHYELSYIIDQHLPSVLGAASWLFCAFGFCSDTWQHLALFETGDREADSRAHPISEWAQMCVLKSSKPTRRHQIKIYNCVLQRHSLTLAGRTHHF